MSHRGNPDQDNDDLWIKPPRWYDGADVIVVGFGGAGAIARAQRKPQVVDFDDNPIPRLYSAGELVFSTAFSTPLLAVTWLN